MSPRDDSVFLHHDSPLVREPPRSEMVWVLLFLCVLLALIALTGLLEPDPFLQAFGVLVCASVVAGVGLQWAVQRMSRACGGGLPPAPQMLALLLLYLSSMALPIGVLSHWSVQTAFENAGVPPLFELPTYGPLFAVLAPIAEIFHRAWGIKAAQQQRTRTSDADRDRMQLAEMERLAHQDALTGLPNRRCFEQSLARLGADDQAFAVMFIDFDKFKPINDQHGHAVGDEFLKAIAKRITSLVREGDLVARLGGDEFAVLIRGRDARLASTQLADRFTQAMKEPVICANVVLLSSASVGIAVGKAGLDDLTHVVHQADLAMYEAKRKGGGCFWLAA